MFAVKSLDMAKTYKNIFFWCILQLVYTS